MIDLTDPTPIWKKKRYLVLFFTFMGNMNLYALRINFSVAVVPMSDIFDWTPEQRGFALGAFFYGYISTQIFGGYMAAKYGGTIVYGTGILGMSLLTFLTPLLSGFGIYYLFMVRILIGAFAGISFPSTNAIYGKWSPPTERSRMASYGVAGSYSGTIIGNLLSGWLGETFGWQSIFHVFGITAVVWCIMWFAIVRDSPDKDRWITDDEKNYIIESLKNQRDQKNVEKVPWLAIFTSVPIMAIAVANFVYNWGFFTLSSLLPSYMNDILNFDLTSSGIISAIPFLVQTLLAFVISPIADYILIKKVLTVTQVRKYFNNTGFLCQMIFLLIAAFLPNTIAIVVCISLSVGFGAFVASGYLSNTIDIAPQFASIITGATNTFGTLAGLISPPLSGFIITTPSAMQYRIIFLITCGIYLIGAIVYGCFAQAKVQPWALVAETVKQKEETTSKDEEKSYSNGQKNAEV